MYQTLICLTEAFRERYLFKGELQVFGGNPENGNKRR